MAAFSRPAAPETAGSGVSDLSEWAGALTPLSAGAVMSDVTTRDQTKHKLPVRTLIAASVGNAVEWYDWTVFATFSIYFATQIFSAQNESLVFILTFTTYALAFFFRPL